MRSSMVGSMSGWRKIFQMTLQHFQYKLVWCNKGKQLSTPHHSGVLLISSYQSGRFLHGELTWFCFSLEERENGCGDEEETAPYREELERDEGGIEYILNLDSRDRLREPIQFCINQIHKSTPVTGKWVLCLGAMWKVHSQPANPESGTEKMVQNSQ